jgi:hypothetical protein
MKRERTAAAWWQLCVLCHGLKGVLCRVRGNKNDDKRRRKRKTEYQQQHVMAGAPMRKSVPFQTQPRRIPYNSPFLTDEPPLSSFSSHLNVLETGT